MGRLANETEEDLEKRIEEALTHLQERERQEALARERVDVTLPGRRVSYGEKHPITQTLEEIVDIFSRLGFEVVEGPEVELDYYNFEALNIPKGHPAREMQATFFISDDVVREPTPLRWKSGRWRNTLRPSGSSLPVRYIDVIRTRHCSPMFHQVWRRASGRQGDHLCGPQRGLRSLSATCLVKGRNSASGPVLAALPVRKVLSR